MQCPWGILAGGEARACGALVRLTPLPGGLCRYERLGPRGEARRLLLPGCSGLELAPSPPLLYPERVGYMLLRLEPPVSLPPGGSLLLRLTVELDAAVLQDGGLVDAYPTGRGKLALYGPPGGGVLARLVEARPGGGVDPCSGALEARIVNESPSPVRVSRLLVPGLGVAAERRGCSVELPRVEALVTGPREARVTVASGVRPGYAPLPLLGRRQSTVTMRHGL